MYSSGSNIIGDPRLFYVPKQAKAIVNPTAIVQAFGWFKVRGQLARTFWPAEASVCDVRYDLSSSQMYGLNSLGTTCLGVQHYSLTPGQSQNNPTSSSTLFTITTPANNTAIGSTIHWIMFISYASTSSGLISFNVNGGSIQTFTVPNTGGISTFQIAIARTDCFVTSATTADCTQTINGGVAAGTVGATTQVGGGVSSSWSTTATNTFNISVTTGWTGSIFQNSSTVDIY
jgi:hypothetical protein